MNETNLFVTAVQLLVPQPCFDKFFLDFDFFNGRFVSDLFGNHIVGFPMRRLIIMMFVFYCPVPAACLKVVLSKGLGYGIILGSILVKVPQIVKMCQARSGEGISVASVIFELAAISANVSYCFYNRFPFSSYGDGVFLSIQTTIVMFLILYFGGNFLGSFMFLIVYGVIMGYLLSPMVPFELLEAIQGVNIIIVILSKLIQIIANYRNSSTGQLSAITVFLIFLGSISRIFTSIQETGDQLVIFMYICSSFFNGILSGQIVYYSKAKQKSE